ncbi:MAG: ankyrin repeat domain-containing protein [Parachlamydia sp.]|nr:ankyrin repeat domain-containing protein [Parachlamydia sp.]
MSIKIESNLAGLQQINSSLNSDAVSDQALEKTVSNLSKLLSELKTNVEEGFTPLTEILRPEAIEVLHHLDQTLDTYRNKVDRQKIQEIKDRILNVQVAVSIAPLHDEKKIPPIEIKPIAFFCDLESSDYNMAIWSMIKQAIAQDLPFVTTRSLLRGTGYVHPYGQGPAKFFIESEQFLLQEKGNWDVFQKGEMLVFMPRSYLPEMGSQEKLASFDFKTDNSLQHISMQEALQGPQKKCDIDAFIDLFVAEPKVNKLFHLAGHGFTNMVGALKPPQYGKFLNFLDNQRCKGLSITSCFSGGKSSLLSIPERESDRANFFAQEKPHSFPTLMRSMGDFPSLAGQEAEKDLKGFLDEFAAFVSAPEGQTFAQLKRRIEMLEEGKEKKISNLMQFYPAHSAGSPVAPRSLAEGARGFPITYALVKRTEIASLKPFSTSDSSHQIVVKDAELLEVYPLVTRAPIRYVSKNPILLSKAAGKGHHFIQSLELAPDENQDFVDFIKSISNFYQEHKSGKDTRYDQSEVDKGFFVETIKDPAAPNEPDVKGLALCLSTSGLFAVLNDGQGYIAYSGKGLVSSEIDPLSFTTKELDPLSYAILSYEIAEATRGQETAIRAMSAGQESETLFQEAIQEANFFPDPFFSLFTFKKNSVECVPNFMELMQGRSIQEKEQTIIFLLKHGHADLALRLAKEQLIDYDLKDFKGSSLLDLAIQADSVEFVEHALRLIDPNIVNPNGMTPLHLAVSRLKEAYQQQAKAVQNEDKTVKKREKILDLLLTHPKINVEVKSKGWPPLVAALPHPTLVNKLIEKGANLGICIDLFVSRQDYESVELLLELKADPNGFQALAKAVNINDLGLVQKLLQAGAEVDVSALNEAIFKASPAIVQLLIETESCPLRENVGGITPMFAALITGNDEKIKMLKEKNAPLPESFYSHAAELSGIFERFLLSDDRAGLAELVQVSHNFNFTCEMIKYLLDKNFITLLKEVIAQDNIDVNALGQCNVEGFQGDSTILQFLLQRTQDSELIELSFHKVTDFNKADFFNALIKQGRLDWIKSAVEQKGAKIQGSGEPGQTLPLQSTDLTTEAGQQIFKWLVEQGADLNAAGKDNKTAFCHVIASGNFELVKYCLSKGAKIVLEDANLASPLAFAATVQKSSSTEIFKHLFQQAQGDINAEALPPAATVFAALAFYGDLELVEWALEHGAEVNSKGKPGQSSPIDLSAERPDDPEAKVFRRLIAAGAQLDDLSNKALIGLIKRGDKELVEYCYEHGSAQNLLRCPDYSNETRHKKIGEIAAEGNLVMMEFLFKDVPDGLGFFPNRKIQLDGKLRTLFECAIKAQPTPQKETIRFLLDHNDDARQQIDGVPALYYAVSRGDPELVKLLLDKGAVTDIHAANRETGQTALELACVQGDSTIIELLQKHIS